MPSDIKTRFLSRRSFLELAAVSGAVPLFGQAASEWKNRIGLELYTVRDLLDKDFEGTIAKVAEIGYREVEPVGYGGLDPKAFRALLDRYHLRAVSTHAGVKEDADLEKQLAGQQLIGLKYTSIEPGSRTPQGSKKEARGAEKIKRIAKEYNRQGAIVRKFGMKILVHNHAGEFDPLPGSPKREYDILLAETDPALVAMQLDIGWARVAGQDVAEMFRRNPGRYELWHVKDVEKLEPADSKVQPSKRPVNFVPVGQGVIDYKAYFAQAKVAGLKAFVIEQDNAGEDGRDSVAAARASYQGLSRILS